MLHFFLEAVGEVKEDEDEELLQTHSVHVDVETALDCGRGDIAAGGHGGASGLGHKSAVLLSVSWNWDRSWRDDRQDVEEHED